jgi:hypothetical protein
MGISQMFAHHRAILGLHKSIIMGMANSAFGEADQEPILKVGDHLVYKLEPIVGMKPSDDKSLPICFPDLASGNPQISSPQRTRLPIA